MNRDGAIDLLHKAGVPDEQINEEAILVASVIGAAVAHAFAEVIAREIVAMCVDDTILDAEVIGD